MPFAALEHTLQDLGVIVGLVISILAFRRAGGADRRAAAADRRDREAILAVEALWQGRRAPGTVDLEHAPALLWNRTPYPHEPDERWAIAVPYNESPSGGVTVRPATSADDLDKDTENYATWRTLVSISNHGRAAAVDVTLRMLASIKTTADLREHDDPNWMPVVDVKRTVAMTIKAVAAGAPRYIEFRSFPGLPTSIEFLDATSGDGTQPIRLTGDKLLFLPRG